MTEDTVANVKDPSNPASRLACDRQNGMQDCVTVENLSVTKEEERLATDSGTESNCDLKKYSVKTRSPSTLHSEDETDSKPNVNPEKKKRDNHVDQCHSDDLRNEDTALAPDTNYRTEMLDACTKTGLVRDAPVGLLDLSVDVADREAVTHAVAGEKSIERRDDVNIPQCMQTRRKE